MIGMSKGKERKDSQLVLGTKNIYKGPKEKRFPMEVQESSKFILVPQSSWVESTHLKLQKFWLGYSDFSSSFVKVRLEDQKK